MKKTLFGFNFSATTHSFNNEAGNGIRTHDIQLGRLTLYQLSYSRNTSLLPTPLKYPASTKYPLQNNFPSLPLSQHLPFTPTMEGVGFEPTKALCRQIYSLLPLASRASLHIQHLHIQHLLCPHLHLLPSPPPHPLPLALFSLAGGGTRTRDLLITNQLLYQLSYTGKVSRTA